MLPICFGKPYSPAGTCTWHIPHSEILFLNSQLRRRASDSNIYIFRLVRNYSWSNTFWAARYLKNLFGWQNRTRSCLKWKISAIFVTAIPEDKVAFNSHSRVKSVFGWLARCPNVILNSFFPFKQLRLIETVQTCICFIFNTSACKIRQTQ